MADEQSAEHRAAHITDAADDCGYKCFQAEHHPHRIGSLLGLAFISERIEETCGGREHRADHKRETDDEIHVHTHQTGNARVETDGTHRHAEFRAEDQVLKGHHERDRVPPLRHPAN
jgi:hypothetical protein